MPAGTTLSQALAAFVNEIEVSILFPVLGTSGLVSLTGVIVDVGTDYIKWQSTPKTGPFYMIPINAIAAITTEIPPSI
jgi:hypothetical protein